jgi:hypothetical protein
MDVWAVEDHLVENTDRSPREVAGEMLRRARWT